jgi:hypothetical protein
VRGDLDGARALAAAYRARFPDGFLRATVDALDPDRPDRPDPDR